MSRPRYDWWGYAKGMIRRYPALSAQLADVKSMTITPGYGSQPGAHEAKRTTELRAIAELPTTAQREFEAVDRAIHQTEGKKDGKERIRLIELVFWRRSHTLSGAAYQLHVSYSTASAWHREFIRLVAKNYGLLDT